MSYFLEIISSRKSGIVFLRSLLFLSASIASIASLRLVWDSFAIPYVYRKDFIQEYLLAKASIAGINPYLSMPELASIFFDFVPAPLLNHPTPHPPPILLVSLPFGWLDYRLASFLWFVLEFLLLLISFLLLLKWLGVHRLWASAFLATFLAFGWEPMLFEVVNGQLEIMLLFLFISVWLSYRKGWQLISGVLLGFLLSFKLFGWPILIYLAFKRKWRLVTSTCLTFIGMNLLSAMIIGLDRTIYYYLQVGQLVVRLYRAYSANFSLYSIGWRMFDGTGSPILIGVEAGPLIYSSLAAFITAYSLPLVFLIYVLYLANKIKNFDTAYAMLVSASFLVNPIVWHHYLVIAILPVIIIGRYLISANVRKSIFYFYLMVIVLLYIRHTKFYDLTYVIGGLQPNSGVSVHVSFWVSLLTLIPMVPVIGLIWLCWKLSNVDDCYMHRILRPIS